ncbi:MAG: hypothetical protein H6707_20350 [Deltaproteobacteria bacterium]|nr:hypothetical protein [Deltaproteobacteria bacterium]
MAPTTTELIAASEAVRGGDDGDLIESRFALHDSHRIELKVDYARADQSGVDYRVESFFFIPSSLGIDSQSYPSDRFYRDVQAHIRFKTPNLALDVLKGDDDTVLGDLRELLGRCRRNPSDENAREHLVVELKMFGCVVRANVRNTLWNLCQRVREGRRDRALLDIQSISERFHSDIGNVLTRFREFRARLVDGVLARRVADTYLNVDEFISLAVEYGLAELVAAIDSSRNRAELEPVRRAACDGLLQERGHRKAAGYGSLVDDDDRNNEYFVYRRGRLKKFVTSALWLEIERVRGDKGWVQLAAAIAAGVAMAFAVLSTVGYTRWFGINSSGFIVAAVISYMMKDRIKDALKSYFSRRMTRWLADYSVRIIDPIGGQHIGRCREAVCHIRSEDLPHDVRELRRTDDTSSIEADSKPETILKYEKQIRIHRDAVVQRLHSEHFELSDILRFDFSEFLTRTDDARSMVAVYDAASNRVSQRELPKVYHTNVIVVLTAERKAVPSRTLYRVRVVFDRRGIRRLERVD